MGRIRGVGLCAIGNHNTRAIDSRKRYQLGEEAGHATAGRWQPRQQGQGTPQGCAGGCRVGAGRPAAPAKERRVLQVAEQQRAHRCGRRRHGCGPYRRGRGSSGTDRPGRWRSWRQRRQVGRAQARGPGAPDPSPLITRLLPLGHRINTRARSACVGRVCASGTLLTPRSASTSSRAMPAGERKSTEAPPSAMLRSLLRVRRVVISCSQMAAASIPICT